MLNRGVMKLTQEILIIATAVFLVVSAAPLAEGMNVGRIKSDVPPLVKLLK